MVLWMLFLWGLFLSFSHANGMEVIEVEKTKDRRIRSLDAAQVLVSAYPQEERGNYSLSSRIIAQIIKQKDLGSTILPNDGEVAIIKTLKKDDAEKYKKLVAATYQLLHGDVKVDELDHIRQHFFVADSARVENKQTALDNLNYQIESFDKYVGNSKKFWGNGGCPLLLVSLVMEAMILVVTGIISGGRDGGDNSCWSSWSSQ